MPGLRLIVGLGNPGLQYFGTRHNAGFWFIDALAQQHGVQFGSDIKLHAETVKATIEGQAVWLLKPTTFMNKSGIAIASALRYYKIAPQEMLVAHDDLDLPAGTGRLKFDGGHGGQNGLRDIFTYLGHGKFYRLRLGIGHPGHKDQVTPWVLGRPGKTDETAILSAVSASLEVLPLMIQGKFDEVMKRLHTAKLKS